MCLLPLQWLHCWLPIKPFPDASVSWCPPLELCPLQRLDQLPNRMLEVPLHPQLAAGRGALQCVELSTRLCEISQCPEKASTRDFSLLKAIRVSIETLC